MPRTGLLAGRNKMSDRDIPQPDCPMGLRVNDHVPMAHVCDVDLSIEFYAKLGFNCVSRYSDHDGRAYYAAMHNDRAEIMLTRASEPIVADQQAVLFYMYANDVRGLREHLLAKGLPDAGRVPGERKPMDSDNPIPPGAAVFEIHKPFYMTEGELRVHDLDGYVILIGQTERNYKPSGAATRKGSIGQIAITVSDVDTATKFYREIIGLQFLFAAGPNLSFLSDGAVRIMLSTPQGAGTVGDNSILYFKVDSIQSTYEAMLQKGATPERPPQMVAQMPDHQLWIGFVRDPDSNLVGIMEEKR
jgi:predicted enzyme related to lactoylglutathione lyase